MNEIKYSDLVTLLNIRYFIEKIYYSEFENDSIEILFIKLIKL